MSLFRYITNDPALRLMNRQQFRQVQGDLFEFKRNDVKSRIFAFRHGRAWYLVGAFTAKKEDELPPRVVSNAVAEVNEAKSLLTSSEGEKS